MFEIVEAFLKAFNAYKAWVECGKDFMYHTDLFEAWDQAVQEYASLKNVSRNNAALEIFYQLDLENRAK